MTKPEVEQLELLARIDELVGRLSHWAAEESAWEPMNRARALFRRLLGRVEQLRIRLEAPLVVATFGGTGTGKSSLVNALIGAECTATGRQRPTTTQPVLIAHPQTELDALGLDLDDFRIVRHDASLLRDIVIIDCPDPDTNEAETPASNLERLHHLLPHCDVLIYVSTQQKYRSARVTEELAEAATGCRLVFVQTHADVDSDIRQDWRKQLDQNYNVPDVFFVDSLKALREQQAGQFPSGDFGRLIDLLTTQLAASERVRIRRANLIDLLHEALDHSRKQLAGHWPEIEQLEAALEEQRHKLTTRMAERLRGELLVSRNLWERRLLDAVTQLWGFSPFSSALRLYNGLGGLIASMSLYRARTPVQVALVGAAQGMRWFKSQQDEKEASGRLGRLSSFGLDDDSLREAQLVIGGYVQSARLDPGLLDRSSMDRLRHEAARVEDQFLGDASRRIDHIIERLAQRNSRWYVRFWYELLFGAYVLFVLFRIGKNFFYDTFYLEFIAQRPEQAAPLLSTDFYISAAVFFVIWSGLLVMAFTRRLRRGLESQINRLASELAELQMSRGLFPQLEETCTAIARERQRLDNIAASTADLRRQIAATPHLGAPSPTQPLPTG